MEKHGSNVRYMHVRVIDENGVILPNGGITIAYMATPKDIMLHMAQCHHMDNYEKRLGRVKAAGRLCGQGPMEILTRVGSDAGSVPTEIAEWLGSIYLGGITITRNEKGQWVSDFEYQYNVGDGEVGSSEIPQIVFEAEDVGAACCQHHEKAA